MVRIRLRHGDRRAAPTRRQWPGCRNLTMVPPRPFAAQSQSVTAPHDRTRAYVSENSPKRCARIVFAKWPVLKHDGFPPRGLRAGERSALTSRSAQTRSGWRSRRVAGDGQHVGVLFQLNQRGDTNGLMESAHRHDTPPVVHLLTDRQGHGLRFELNLLQAPQCSPAGGSVHSFTDRGDAAVPLGPAPSSHQFCAPDGIYERCARSRSQVAIISMTPPRGASGHSSTPVREARIAVRCRLGTGRGRVFGARSDASERAEW
jgi:hypothetical protein